MSLLRRARPDDLGLILRLVEDYCEADGHVFEEEKARAGLVPLLASDDHGVVWLIEVEGQVEGYAVVTWGWSVESGGRDALLDEVYLRRRGEGLGTAAIGEILDRLREQGLPRAFLETESHNEAARRLYRRLGFSVEDSVWMSIDLAGRHDQPWRPPSHLPLPS